MGFCDIVVDARPGGDARPVLELAREMATWFGARLFVVAFAWPLTTVTEALAGSSLSVHRQTQEMRNALAASRDAFDRIFSDTSLDLEWCEGIGDPAAALRDHLLISDLLITGTSEGHDCIAVEATDLALYSGSPVLRIGETAAAGGFRNVLVAWKDCPQARRALHGALPILKRAERVTVVGIGDEISALRLEAVAGHLGRHGVASSHLHLSHSEQHVGADLVCQAQREKADLIVAGLYSRGPIAERVLGGVTRELLRATDLSWFMAY